MAARSRRFTALDWVVVAVFVTMKAVAPDAAFKGPALVVGDRLARALGTRTSPLAASDPELGPFDHVALARMDDAEVLRRARAMQTSLRRYVPGAIAEQLESGGDLQAGEREVTVLFVGLRGFTAYAGRRPVEDVFSTVNEHTECTSAIVRRRGGAVVEFNGDGMMAVLGAPEALPEKERQRDRGWARDRRLLPARSPRGDRDRDGSRVRGQHTAARAGGARLTAR